VKIFEFFANQSEKRPWLVVIAVVLVTAFLAAGFPRIETELSQESMMPKGYESIQAYDEVKDLVGGYASLAAFADATESGIYGVTALGYRDNESKGYAIAAVVAFDTPPGYRITYYKSPAGVKP